MALLVCDVGRNLKIFGGFIVGVETSAPLALTVTYGLQLRACALISQGEVVAESLVCARDVDVVLLRASLTIEFVHDVLGRVPTLYLVAVLQGQHLACTESVEEFLALVYGRVASLWVDVGLVEGRTAEAVEYPPVDVLVDGLRVGGARSDLGIIILGLVEHVEPFRGVGQRTLDAVDGTAEGAVIGNVSLAFLATLGGNEDNATRGTRTIDGGRGILQHGDVLNVVAVHGVQLVDGTSHTVDDDEWRGVAIHGNITTNLESCTLGTRTGRCTCNGQTRNLTLQGYGSRRYGAVFEHFLTLDLGDGRSKGRLLLLTITYHHHIVEKTGILLERDFDVAALRVLDGLGLIANVRNLDRTIRVLERKLAIEVGDGTILAALHTDRRTDNGITVLVYYNTLYGIALLLLHAHAERLGCRNMKRRAGCQAQHRED